MLIYNAPKCYFSNAMFVYVIVKKKNDNDTEDERTM